MIGAKGGYVTDVSKAERGTLGEGGGGGRREGRAYGVTEVVVRLYVDVYVSLAFIPSPRFHAGLPPDFLINYREIECAVAAG